MPRIKKPYYPAGCGPPRKIAVVLSAEQLAIAGALGFGMPAKGVKAALDQIAHDRPVLRDLVKELRHYKKLHPEHDWELQQHRAEYHKLTGKHYGQET